MYRLQRELPSCDALLRCDGETAAMIKCGSNRRCKPIITKLLCPQRLRRPAAASAHTLTLPLTV